MNNVYDIVCIGAGVSGLYLANKLMNENPEKSMFIMDKFDRVGGHLMSVPLEGVEYQAEGGSNRILASQLLTLRAMMETGTQLTEATYTAKSTSESTLLKQMAARGPRPGDEKISNFDGIINWPNIPGGSYDNIEKFTALSGFGFGDHTTSMEMALKKTLATIPDSVQYFPHGGYSAFAEKLANNVVDKYPIMLDIEALEINRMQDGDYKYEVVTTAGSYYCNHVVYTGDRHNLYLLGGDSDALRQLKELMYDVTGTDITNLRMYFTVDQPWWTEDQIGHVVNDFGPIAQIVYASPNSFFIYNQEQTADILYYMVPSELRHLGVNNMQWIDASTTPRLSQFVKKYVIEMINKVNYQELLNDDNVNFGQMAFKYTPQTTFTYTPTDVPLESITRILNDFDGIHLVSDAYYETTGWIEDAFKCVNRTYPSIIT